jgi:hypothetical protein
MIQAWQVTTPAGQFVVRGRKAVVTTSGALMILGDGEHPRHIFGQTSWSSCELLLEDK